MTDTKMQLVDWLDDLCVRFIINLPHEELQSVERICFQIEEAQWFYEDFIRPLDPNLPSMNLRKFSQLMFQHCPLSSSYSSELHVQAYENFLAYKTRVPVRGAIMLNQEMTHAVLVKGWKKGAKWSFPRGKINKDESDLDCAVREVYEETGYDLKDTTLVGPDEQMKKITVNMREQSMLLYVFRGVPMDTHFEPRTRKEISKIDWYKLTDLPTLKRKNQVQQGVGQDLVKDNSFYMVAPFLGPLKAWIKQQHKLDRQKARTGGYQGHLVPTGVTDNELEADFGETTADEAPILDTQPADDNFAMLVAKLGASKRGSDALPEVSVQPQALDPAAELKKLLSVGMTQTPVEAPGPQSNPLLAMLHASNSAASAPPEPIPRTPLEQLMTAPPQPHSPHGQHHPRAPQLQNMPAPPPFPFQSQRGIPFRGSPHNQMPPQHHNGMPMSIPRQFIPPPPHQVNPVFPTHAPNVQEAFSQQAPRPYQQTGDPQFAQSPQFPGVHGPAIPPASKLPAPKLTAHALGLLNAFKADDKPSAVAQLQQSLEPTPRVHPPPSLRGYESFASQQSLPSANPYVPSPPPFQSPPPSANFQPVQPKPRSAHQDSLLHLFHAASVASGTPPPQLLEEPAELSAQPNTPGYTRIKPTVHEAPPPKAELAQGASLLDAFNAQMKKKGLTSATVSGPVNAPDFDTMKKNTHHHGMNGHSRGPSPGIHEAGSHHQMFIPQQILKRSESTSKSPTDIGGPAPNAGSQSTSNMTTPQATVFKPQILKRPSQNAPPAPGSAANSHAQGLLDIFKQVSPQPAAVAPATGPAPNTHAQGLLDIFKQASPQPVPASPAQLPSNTAPQTAFDRRENFPPEQKNSLLALFGKPSQPVSPMMPSRSPVPPQGITKPPPGLPALPTKSPQPMTPNPQPPTPKNIASAVISPVSPLPDKSSQMNSPANLASRSRISSIGDVSAPSIIIPPTSHPTSHPASSISQLNGGGGIGSGTEEGYTSADSLSANLGELSAGGSIRRAPSAEGKSPVDKTFLLGFLEDVARRGR